MRRVVISDLSGPCGQEAARYFLQKGVAVAGLRAQGLPDDLSAVEAYDFDATTVKGCAGFAQALRSDGKDFDALVVTGRHIQRSAVLDEDAGAFEQSMAHNTKAAFFLCQQVGGILREKGRGAVILVGSIHGEKPTGGAAFGFSASMGALKMMHREAALPFGRDGVHVVLLEMGPTKYDEEVMDSTLSSIYDGFELNIPRRKACTFEELAPIIDMCIQNPMLNGAEIRTDGGFILKYGDK